MAFSSNRSGRQDPYLIGFYERLLDQGRRMLHMHFQFLERTPGSEMLTGEHDEMLAAITARDADRADTLAYAHTRHSETASSAL